jgi:hypothetical protein
MTATTNPDKAPLSTALEVVTPIRLAANSLMICLTPPYKRAKSTIKKVSLAPLQRRIVTWP